MHQAVQNETRLNRNVIANFVGQIAAASLAILLVPVYIGILGIESYGLIGFYTLLQMLLGIFEVGIYLVLGRDMARFTAGELSARRVGDVFRSYLLAAILLGALATALIWILAGTVAEHWLRPSELTGESIRTAIGLMGVVVGLRLAETVFRSVLLGLQKQVAYNVIFASMAIIRYAGVIGFLLVFSRSVDAFFVWQVIVSVVGLCLYGLLTVRVLPSDAFRLAFSLHDVIASRRFAAGTILITMLSVLLRQVDKLYLSRSVDLVEFGYYSLASVVAAVPVLMAGPLCQAFYPRFVELFSGIDQEAIRTTYHKATLYVGVVAVAAGLPVVFFPEELLVVWSGDEELARRVAPVLRVLVAGGIIDAMLMLPYRAQVACGWTRLAVMMLGSSLAIMVLAVVFLIPAFGLMGAAYAWLGVNVLLLVCWVPLMSRRILRGTAIRWYLASVLAPVLGGSIGALSLGGFFPEVGSRWTGLLVLVALATAMTGLAFLFSLIAHRLLAHSTDPVASNEGAVS